MIVILVESLISCSLFTMIVGSMTYFNPLGMIHDYPPAIQQRVKELGLITDDKNSYSKAFVVRKILQ